MKSLKSSVILASAIAAIAIASPVLAQGDAPEIDTDLGTDTALQAAPFVAPAANDLPYKSFAPIMRRSVPTLDNVKSCLRGVAPENDVTLCGPVHALRDAWIAAYGMTPQIKTFERAGGTFVGFYVWLDAAYSLENECQLGYALTGYATPDTGGNIDPDIQPGQWFTKCNHRYDGNYYNQIPATERYGATFDDNVEAGLIQVFFENLHLTLYEDGSFE